MRRYVLTTALLGAGCFPILLLPPITRGWLLESPGTSFALLVGAAIAIAVAFRRWIARAESLRTSGWP